MPRSHDSILDDFEKEALDETSLDDIIFEDDDDWCNNQEFEDSDYDD